MQISWIMQTVVNSSSLHPNSNRWLTDWLMGSADGFPDMHPQQTIFLDTGSLRQTLLMRHNQHASVTPGEEPSNCHTTHPNLPQISEGISQGVSRVTQLEQENGVI